MKLSALFGSLALVLIVSGCASNQHVYSSDGKCLTCWNNPITGKPINHDGKANQEQTAQESQVTQTTTTETTVVNTTTAKPTEHKIAFTVPVNVDVAFLKIKKEFNYYTEQEIRQEWGAWPKPKCRLSPTPTMQLLRFTTTCVPIATTMAFRQSSTARSRSSLTRKATSRSLTG